MVVKKLQPKRLRARDLEQIKERLRLAPREFLADIAALLQHVADLRDRLFDLESEHRTYKMANEARKAEAAQVRETARVVEEKLTAEYVSPEERERIRNEVRMKTAPHVDPRLPKEDQA